MSYNGGHHGYAGDGYGHRPGFITLTESAFEALNEYQGKKYNVIGRGRYVGGTLIQAADWTYAAGDLHVSKSGNDTTGDGSYALPYLTIGKAVSVVSSAGGKTIWVNAGTYAENNAALGYLTFATKAYDAPLVIRSKPGDSVTLTNASGSMVIRFNGVCNRIIFHGLNIVSAAGSTTLATVNSGSNAANNVEFRECTFADASSNTFGMFFQGTSVSSGVAIKRCAFSSAGNFAQYFTNCSGLRLIGNSYSSTGSGGGHALRLLQISGNCFVNENTIAQPNQLTTSRGIYQESALAAATVLTVKRNTVTSPGRMIDLTGGATGISVAIYCEQNVLSGGRGIELSGGVQGSRCSSNRVTASGSVGIGWPTDSGSSLIASDSEIDGNEILATGAVGHGLLIGVNSESAVVRGNISDARPGGTYGLVLKGDAHTVEGNTFYGGNFQAVYLKGATDCLVQNNSINQTISGGQAIDFADDGVIEAANNEITDNDITVTDGVLYGFVAADIGAGNVVDGNRITVSGSGAWGSMFGAFVGSLAAVRASWVANYDVTTNDATSVEV